MGEKQYEALEYLLTDLAAGQDANSLSAANPDLANEIEAAQWARSLAEEPVPVDAAHRSRTRVLARADQLGAETRPRGGVSLRLPRLALALMLVLILLISWNGLVVASAQALPGDQLYPAKITLERLHLGLALNPQTHQEVEEEYLARRVDEVARLLALGRVEFVQFFGVVATQADDFWLVDGIEVRLIPETIILGEILPGMTVEVEGATQPEGWVQASEIHLQHFSFQGTVESISKHVWIISGREVLITPNSVLDPDINTGDTVIVEVTSDDFGNLTLWSIKVLPNRIQESISTGTPWPVTDTPTNPPEPSETERPDDADEPDETDEADETEKPDESDEPDETNEPDESDEPDETNEPDDTDEPDETDKTEEPDDTDESDETEKP